MMVLMVLENINHETAEDFVVGDSELNMYCTDFPFHLLHLLPPWVSTHPTIPYG